MQKQPASQCVPGYDPKTGPSISLPKAEHQAIPNGKGNYTGTPRDLLAKNLSDIRNFTSAPNSSIKELATLNKTMYPQALSRPVAISPTCPSCGAANAGGGSRMGGGGAGTGMSGGTGSGLGTFGSGGGAKIIFNPQQLILN